MKRLGDRGKRTTPMRRRYLTGVSAVALGAATAIGSFAAMPAPANAQGVLEEIVVTARFREERLQQTPLAVSAFSAESLDVRGITEIDQIGESVPNAYIRPEGATPVVGMRGKINQDYFNSLQPTVALYIDGSYFGRQTGMNFGLFDVERVEVLRGPQGTLFGKNALGGAIRIVTRQPEGNGTGFVEASAGNYNRIEMKGAVDFAITDNLFTRITAVSQKRDGYIKKLDFACEMHRQGTPELAGYGDGIVGAHQVATSPFGTPIYAPTMGEPGSAADNNFAFPFAAKDLRYKDNPDDPSSCKTGDYRDKDVQGGRIQLRYVGFDDVEIQLSANFIDDDSEAYVSTLKEGITLGGLDRLWIMGEILPRYGLTPDTFDNGTAEPNDGAFFIDPKRYATYETYRDPMNAEDFDFGEQVKRWGLSSRILWDVSSNVQLTSISSFRRMEVWHTSRSGRAQTDGTPFDYIHNSGGIFHEEWQQEIRVDATLFDGRLDTTIGGFYYETDESNLANIDIEPLTFLGIFPTKLHNDEITTTNYSAFMHNVFSVTDKLSATAGIRWTNEERIYNFQQEGILEFDEPVPVEDSRLDWKLGLDYALTEEHFIYASAASGFRSAGFQIRPWTPGQNEPFEQEEVISYEVGFKGDFFDQRLRLNVAGFYDDYDPRVVSVGGFQCNPFNADDPGPVLFEDELDQPGDVCPEGTPIAGQPAFNYTPYVSTKSTVKGVEVEVEANPLPGLNLNYSLGYNKFTVSDQYGPDDPRYRHPDNPIQPRWNMSGGIQYTAQLPNDGGSITPRLDWNYRSHETNGDVQTPPGEGNIIPSVHRFNARLSYTTPERDWTASLQVRNLFDKFYWNYFNSPQDFGVAGTVGAPRMWWFTVRHNF